MDGEQAAASRGAEETGLGTKAEPGAELAADHVVKAMGATVVAFVESASTSIIPLAFAKGYRYKINPPPPGGQVGYEVVLHLSRLRLLSVWNLALHITGGYAMMWLTNAEFVKE